MPEILPPSWPLTSSELSGLGAKPRLLLQRPLQRWLLCLSIHLLRVIFLCPHVLRHDQYNILMMTRVPDTCRQPKKRKQQRLQLML